MFSGGLALLNNFNWKEETPIVLETESRMPSSPCLQKTPPLLNPEVVKFQYAWSLLEVIVSILQLSYRLYYLYYILVLNIFGLFRAFKNVGSKIRWLKF